MNKNGQTPKLEIRSNTDYKVKILGHKSGESEFGPWNLYNLEFNGEKYSHFAQPGLHEQLKDHRTGDNIIIRKQVENGDGYRWIVESGFKKQAPVPSTASAQIDDRTHDIHRQVCLKTAIQSFPSSDRPWDDEIVNELKRRADLLMSVLEGDRDDLPF